MSGTPEEPVKEPVNEPVGDAATDAKVNTTADAATEVAEVVDPVKAAAELENAKRLFQERAKSYLVDQQQHVVVPSYSAWFDISKIHSIEKKLFPDFFPPSKTSSDEFRSAYKTAEIYKNIRDFMINAYRINPLEYLTVTAARRNLAGDVTSIIRIHHFLEKWGLINYQIDPRTKSSVVGPQFTGHFQITLDTPSGLVPFLPEAKKSADKSTIEDSITATESISTSVNSEESPLEELPLNLEARRNIYIKSSDLSKKIPNNSVHFFCNVCGKECTKTRYHNLKVKAYNNNPNSTNNNASIVCVNCFEQGLFPQNFYSSDFIKLKEEVESTNSWSEQETLLLLEGIEIYGTYDATIQPGNSNSNSNGQWDKISEHVGTKSREECLIKFIQLPIEDRYLTKLSKKEEKPVKNEGNGLIVSEIIKEIVSKNDSETNKEISTIASKKVETSNDEQLSLVNQVIELTLEKVSLKLSSIDALEENLIAKEKKLEQERKQVYYERWAQFEKINKYKAEHPELSELLDNLATPIKLQEVVKAKGSEESKKEEGGNDGDYMDIDLASNGLGEPNSIPVSVSNPKSYQFWSG